MDTHIDWKSFWENLLTLVPGVSMTGVSPLIFFFALADLISYWPVISCLPCFTSFLASTPLRPELITEQSAPGVEGCTQREQ